MSWKKDLIRSWTGAPKGRHRATTDEPSICYVPLKLPLNTEQQTSTATTDLASPEPRTPEQEALDKLRLVETRAAEIRKTLASDSVLLSQPPGPGDRMRRLMGTLQSLETQAQVFREAVQESSRNEWTNIPGGFLRRLNEEEVLIAVLPPVAEISGDPSVSLEREPLARPTDWLGTLVPVRDVLPPATQEPDVPKSVSNSGIRIITLDS